jgi:hypothetical protein
MQVLSLTQEQINALPDQERGAILQLVRIRVSFIEKRLTSAHSLARSIHGNSERRLISHSPLKNFASVIYIPYIDYLTSYSTLMDECTHIVSITLLHSSK